MTLEALLPYLNLLLVPAVGYIMSQDRKAVRLETKLDALAGIVQAHVAREEKLIELIPQLMMRRDQP